MDVVRRYRNVINLDKLNRICFAVCILCILLGGALTIAMIWAEMQDNVIAVKS